MFHVDFCNIVLQIAMKSTNILNHILTIFVCNANRDIFEKIKSSFGLMLNLLHQLVKNINYFHK